MNQLTPIQQQEVLEKRTHDILEYCKAFEIVDDSDYQMADLKVVECKALMKAIKDHHDPIIAAAHKTHKLATQARKNLYDPPDTASRILASKMACYKHERDAEQAEKQRLLDEKAKAEHEAACEKEAKEMEGKGQQEAAVALREMKQDAPITAPVVEQELRSKTKFRKDWEIVKVNIFDVEPEYLLANTEKAMRMIRAAKGVIKIKGFEFKEIQIGIRRGE